MQNQFSLQKVADSNLGERFVILLNNGVDAHESKPMLAIYARLALHKLGTSEAAIASMMDHARGLPEDESHE